MSFVPPQYLVRLQELKLWQGNYDNLLQKQKNNSVEDIYVSDLDGVQPISDYKKTHINSSEPMDWDKQTILPKTKPFDELIEEKLAEDKPIEVLSKTKQPFLRKGSGLARYKLDPNTKKYREPKVIRNNEKKCHTILQYSEEPSVKSSITPLKAPEIGIQCKATWTKVDNEEEEPIKCSKDNKFNPLFVIEKINEFAQSFRSSKKYNEDAQDLQSVSTFDDYNTDGILENSFSNRSEKELQIFETLEEKIDHSSFLSTNTSIARLLASTPNNIPKSNPKNEEVNVCQELRSSNVLTKILNNLKLISSGNTNGQFIGNIDTVSTGNSCNNSFSEDKKSSKHLESACQSPSSFYTDFESTLSQFDKINAGVNTSFSYQTEDECQKCVDLQGKLERLLRESSKSAVEKAKLYDFTKELEKQCTLLTSEIHKIRMNYDKDVEDLREELDEERKKFGREKALLDMYIKDVRPKKKDCFEMESLKKEMIDLKELMKLKETKNGTTQARLRNQIRQLEKEKSELKLSVENLQKENAKLNATQKVQRNAESRMLQEISRNLNRLTGETMRDTNSADVTKDNHQAKVQKKVRGRSMGELKETVERELQIQEHKVNNKTTTMNNTNIIPPTVEVIYNNDTLEKQQESTLGLIDGEFSQSLGVHQPKKVLVERDFPDGSKEIKFTNGTSKTISPDGNLIYIQYSNGDIRETNLIKNTQKYYFVKKNIWLTKHSDGTEVIEFPNGQKEERFADGKVQVTAQDGTTITTFTEGTQEIIYPDGSKMIKNREEKVIFLTNGQKETHTMQFKKREYPDGTVKIVYPDGTQESRYANGRVRIKDENGMLIMDSHNTETQ